MKNLLEKISVTSEQASKDELKALIQLLRPRKTKHPEEAIENLQNLIAHLRLHAEYREALHKKISSLFDNYDPVYLYAESGIMSKLGFFSEFWRKIKHKILPEVNISNNSIHLINDLFDRNKDFVWVQKIPSSLWIELFELLDFRKMITSSRAADGALSRAIQLLSHNIVSLGLDSDIISKLTHLDKEDSPFLNQNHEISFLLDRLQQPMSAGDMDKACQNILHLLDACVFNIEQLHYKKEEYGVSLHLTLMSKRLLQQIKRIKLLLNLKLTSDKSTFYSLFHELGMKLIKASNQRNNLMLLMNEHVDLLAFEMVEHTAKKGGSYIANNAKEYWSYLRGSMLGGGIIALFALFKIFIDGLSVSPLGQGVLFSINYALCFVLVYLLGGIIATKQPAMTASAVARSMDRNDDGSIDDLEGLKDLIVKVSRSQFISFVGNLILAIPVAFLLALSIESIFDISLVSEYKSKAMLGDIHPSQSASLYYAGIAGIFLSLSGLISGYFSNKLVYSRIPERIEKHPLLNKYFSNRRIKSFADFINRNLGALAGNISLGIFLGMAGTIGFITGIPFDIRHIAFSSANFGYALGHLDWSYLVQLIPFMLLGIAGIGLMNFTVSFGATLFIALKSRKISFVETKALSKLIYRHFITKPLDFFFHPGSFRSGEQLKMKGKTPN